MSGRNTTRSTGNYFTDKGFGPDFADERLAGGWWLWWLLIPAIIAIALAIWRPRYVQKRGNDGGPIIVIDEDCDRGERDRDDCGRNRNARLDWGRIVLYTILWSLVIYFAVFLLKIAIKL
jgi:hypothetical protein